MYVERVEVGPLQVNCWIVGADEEGPLVVIDPGDDAAAILAVVASRPVVAVVLTHGHFDHLGAARAVLAATRAPLLVHEADAPFITDAIGTGGTLFGFGAHTAPPADRTLRDGDTIEAGRLRLTVLHTPGHTPGGIGLLATVAAPPRADTALAGHADAEQTVADPGASAEATPLHLFSGDTLFSGSVGRTDFPRGDARTLAHSIATGLAPLPPDTRVHPGHGPDTSIGREARLNPFWPRA